MLKLCVLVCICCSAISTGKNKNNRSLYNKANSLKGKLNNEIGIKSNGD